MDSEQARRRFSASPVARLATVRPDGFPHLVPVVFAVDGDEVFFAVDDKPKRSKRLQRLANLEHEPRCCLLADHYDDDWSRLWWVRADGAAAVVDRPAPDHPGLLLLSRRHGAYRKRPPQGPLVVVTITRWSGWASQPDRPDER